MIAVMSDNPSNDWQIRSDRLQPIGWISRNTNGALKVIKLLGKPAALGKLAE